MDRSVVRGPWSMVRDLWPQPLIRVDGGFAHRVSDCDIYNTGTGGLALAGGDRKTLTPGRHEALNNHIWGFSRHQLTSAYGLTLAGVGCRAAHNLIHDAPHQAVFVGGNDHVFEFNEVHHVCTETDDCDALKGRQNCFFPDKLLKEVDITKPPYVTHYPELVNYMDPPPGALRVNRAKLNVFVRCTQLSSGNWQLAPGLNWSTDQDPGFVNMDKGNYRLRDGAEVFKRLSGYMPIPFEQMGLQRR